MCHRYNLRPTPDQIVEAFAFLRAVAVEFTAGDIYPANEVPIIRKGTDGEWETATVA